MNPKISCLCSTFGRLSRLNEAVTCFINQDYDDKELIILNNHPAPLFTNLPQVKIYNEPKYPTLGHCRNRLLELADGSFIMTYDDDYYFPWFLSTCIENIGDYPAFKPTRSWFWDVGNKKIELAGNAFEASILVRKEVALKYGYKSNSAGDEHEPLLRGIEKEGGCKTKEMYDKSPYIYPWNNGEFHISGSLGSNTIEERTRIWKENNQDIGNQKVEIVDISNIWSEFNKLTSIKISS